MHIHLLALDVDIDHFESFVAIGPANVCLSVPLGQPQLGFVLQIGGLTLGLSLFDGHVGGNIGRRFLANLILGDRLLGGDELFLGFALSLRLHLHGKNLLIGGFAVGLGRERRPEQPPALALFAPPLLV